MAGVRMGAAGAVVTFEDGAGGSVATDVSPKGVDFVAAVTRGKKTINPGVPVFPGMVSAAGDSMFSRAIELYRGTEAAWIAGSQPKLDVFALFTQASLAHRSSYGGTRMSICTPSQPLHLDKYRLLHL